nr:hypothetical protein [Natribacillus halophilus]
MEKCARPSCNCLAGDNKTIVEGKVYCCEYCANGNHCTDETCTCEPCDAKKLVDFTYSKYGLPILRKPYFM